MADVFTALMDEEGRLLEGGRMLYSMSSEERDTFGWATIYVFSNSELERFFSDFYSYFHAHASNLV